eukprot:CAMPEP_0178446620 /NCGR_PEP_ID=MMETSP0689_2-20121128/40913_1 /TAXON_ID=160604 /ORGANISM="Amphidinium massartii, Strain CS-259" /LENGTH=286 /DNA_ID=CAMNT_0020071481 /DNA_START=38 /DNA_END=895 /DNA_ORIENTATION=-
MWKTVLVLCCAANVAASKDTHLQRRLLRKARQLQPAVDDGLALNPPADGWDAPMLYNLDGLQGAAAGPAPHIFKVEPAPAPGPAPAPAPLVAPIPSPAQGLPSLAAPAPGQPTVVITEWQVEQRPQSQFPAWPGLPATPTAPAAAPSPGLAAAALSGDVCSQMATIVGALSCSLSSEVTGGQDGCECSLQGTTCPSAQAGLGFTALSPSSPIQLPEAGTSIVLCMYWRLHAEPNQAVQLRARQQEAEKLALQLVKEARAKAESEANALVPVIPQIPGAAPAPSPAA